MNCFVSYEFVWIRLCSLYMGMYGFKLYILFYLCGPVVL